VLFLSDDRADDSPFTLAAGEPDLAMLSGITGVSSDSSSAAFSSAAFSSAAFSPSLESGGLGGRPDLSCSSRRFICRTATSKPTSSDSGATIGGGGGGGGAAGAAFEFRELNRASTLFIFSLKFLRVLPLVLTSGFTGGGGGGGGGAAFVDVSGSDGLTPAAAARAANVFGEAALERSVADEGGVFCCADCSAAFCFRNSLYSCA
jgi:hypothetical protein